MNKGPPQELRNHGKDVNLKRIKNISLKSEHYLAVQSNEKELTLIDFGAILETGEY